MSKQEIQTRELSPPPVDEEDHQKKPKLDLDVKEDVKEVGVDVDIKFVKLGELDAKLGKVEEGSAGFDQANAKVESLQEETKTLIIVILDESGSMGSQKKDVIGGYNSFLETQKEQCHHDKARLIFIKFNSAVTIGHNALALELVPELTGQSYRPSSGTALYDAVAEGIRVGETEVKEEERVIVLIMTDGEENSSKLANGAQVKEKITEKEGLGNWTFEYIGANPEKWAKEMGQPKTNSVGYDIKRQRRNMKQMSTAVSSFRTSRLPQNASVFDPE